MEVVVCADAAEIGRLGADAVQQVVEKIPAAVLGIATGSSPRPVYDELARRVRAGGLTLARCSAFMLDEYVGLPPDHPGRYRAEIDDVFTRVLDIDPDRVHGPDGAAQDVPAACAGYERAIVQAGGVDLQILGIGADGHIGFNEPASSLASRTRIKTLTRQTRVDNARFFGGDVDAVPVHCLTQGIATIMEARHILLIATGDTKAEAVSRLVEGPVSAMWPASILQMHPHVTVMLDGAASAGLTLGDYVRETWANKPAWQGF